MTEGAKDIDEFIRSGGTPPEPVPSSIAQPEVAAGKRQPSDLAKDVMAEFKQLEPLEQVLQLKDYAKRMGITVGDMRKVVSQTESAEPQPNVDVVERLEPVSYPVSGLDLANEIREKLNTYVFLPELDSVAITLWAIGSYSLDKFRVFPRLHIHSPEKRCGKSTLLETLEAYCYRSCITSNITAAAMFRIIDGYQPTLIIDEVDSFLAGNEEMRGVINSGHTRRTAFVIRTQGDDYEPKRFSTWTPMVLSGIGEVPETIADRSIRISMRRAKGAEKPNKLPLDHFDSETEVRRRLLRFAQDNSFTAVQIPEIENSRAMDNWSPLFAIAEAIGGEWPSLCKSAYIAATQVTEAEDDSITALLLTDIQEIFSQNGGKIFSAELTKSLGEQADRPWSEWGRTGKPITQNGLANMLKRFNIKPVQVRIGEVKKRGYKLVQFSDALSRYVQSGTTVQASEYAASSQSQSGTEEIVYHPENAPQPSKDEGCTTVPLETGQKGECF
ncbi:DUF3631 domain-containing protein [Candidatus Litorirhabdus singularis]|nr:DUF3631 domain-containing protein [Candidatus Litorirhabdus singularis]